MAMKVRENTPARLRLSGFPFVLALALLAVIGLPVLMAWGYFRAGLVVPGLFLAAVAVILLIGCFGAFVRHRTIILDRAAQTVTVVERGLFGTRRVARSMQGLQGASVQTHVSRPQSSRGQRRGRKPKERRLFRPVLVFAQGPSEPLYDVYAGNNDASIIATAINGWVRPRATTTPP